MFKANASGHTATLASVGVLAGLAAASCAGGVAFGQCQPGWQADFGINGVDGNYNSLSGPVTASISWDPDGPGPQTPVIVFGGEFGWAGSAHGSCVASYDPATGEVVSLPGLYPSFYASSGVFALAVLPNGDLIAGGSFYNNGSTSYLNRWTGTTWVNFVYQPVGTVLALDTLPNGDLIIGGAQDNGPFGLRLIRWSNGVVTSLTSGFPISTSSPPASITHRANGNIIVCSSVEPLFSPKYIAELTPSGWVSMLPANNSTFPFAVRVLSNGDLIAVGTNITVAEPAGGLSTTVARYDGSVWHRLGPADQFPVCASGSVIDAIAELPNGHIAVAGSFRDALNPQQSADLRVWDGTQWNSLNDHIGTSSYQPRVGGQRIQTLTPHSQSNLFAGGNFSASLAPTSTPVSHIANYDGAQWRQIAGGFAIADTDPIAVSRVSLTNFSPLRDGRIYAQGNFTWAGNNPANGAAIFDGSDWTHFPGGSITGLEDAIALTDGSLVFRGTFSSVAGIPANGLIRWSAQNGFENIGDVAGGNQQVQSILALPTGGFIVSGFFTSAGGVPAANIAQWNDGVWSPLSSGLDAGATQLIVSPLGGFIASGTFTQAGGHPANHIARWDGSLWLAFGPGVPVPTRLAAGADGRVYSAASVDGSLRNLSVQTWEGAAWTPGFADRPAGAFAVGSTEEGDVFYIAQQTAPISLGGGTLPALGLVTGNTTQALDFFDASFAAVGNAVVSLRGAAGHQMILDNRSDVSLYNPVTGQLEFEPRFYNRYILTCPPTCDPDLNHDGNADQSDIDYLINVIAGGDNPTEIDPDFNRDGNADQNDIDALLDVVAGGACP
ncbi:MAG: hypothetical protein WC718_02930 [Phycisphaerales bacterium]